MRRLTIQFSFKPQEKVANFSAGNDRIDRTAEISVKADNRRGKLCPIYLLQCPKNHTVLSTRRLSVL